MTYVSSDQFSMEVPSPMRLGREYSLTCFFESTTLPAPDDGTAEFIYSPYAFHNNERNRRIQAAFISKSPYIERNVKRRLESPYVPAPRTYPNAGATREFEQYRRKLARVLLGFTLLRRPGVRKAPQWGTLLKLLLEMTPRVDQTQRMAVVKVIMPKDKAIKPGKGNIELFDSKLNKFVRLRAAVPKNPNSTSIVLRGRHDLVNNAVNDFAAKYKDIQIYQLGDIGSISYEVMCLWPRIEGMSVEVKGKKTQYPDRDALEKTVWMHREPPTQWINIPYQEIPRPLSWTKESLEAYTATIANSRLRPDLVMKFYRLPGPHGKLVNTEAMRIQLLLSTMDDITAQKCATAPVIERIMALAARHLGYITKARKLLIRAEKLNVPLGTDAFNILLQGYLVRHDISFFHTMLFLMEQVAIPPNTYTWLLFLKLVQRRIIREKVIAAMQGLGMLEDLAARRSVAIVMADHEAYLAFHQGATLKVFVEEYSKRWIDNEWLPEGALNAVLTEHLRFHHKHDREILLRYATYTYLVALAQELHLPATLGVIFFYGVLERKLRFVARKVVDRVLLAPGGRRSPVGWADSLNLEPDSELDPEGLFGTDIRFPFYEAIDESCLDAATMNMENEADEEEANYDAPDDAGSSVVSQQDDCNRKMKATPWFWRNNPARILSQSMSRAEWAILTSCPGYEPLKPLAHMVRTAFYNIDQPKYHGRHKRDGSAASASLEPDKLVDNTEMQDGTMHDLDVPLVDVQGQRASQVTNSPLGTAGCKKS
ncbi:hypothetical protein CDD81_7353 [Ophiocordyceps australis]|uniref:Uncharacterized protein n=1 Tax=Ophiocordyceps australis TaxID=1399860 RepID=A0A2C5Y3G9_9HYPO|nr:hypothetical protein CDD81_7353 [Ophiocordyceps australis]